MKARSIQLEANDFLFRQGDAPQSMFLVKTGVVALVSERKGHTVELLRANAGQMIGELSFFFREPRANHAKALTPCEVIEIPFTLVQKDFETFPPWLKVLLNTMSAQVLKFNRELKQFRVGEDGSAANMHRQLLRFAAALELGLNVHGEAVENGGRRLAWESLRSVTSQIFSLPFHQMEKLVRVLCETPYFEFTEKGDEAFVTLTGFNPEALAGFIRWTGQALQDNPKLLEPTAEEVGLVKTLARLSAESEANWKGIVSLPGSVVMEEWKKESERANMTVIDQLKARGLGVDKQSVDGGINLIFHGQEIRELAPTWEILTIVQRRAPLKAEAEA